MAVLNPTLLAAVMTMLLLPHHKRLMLGYLAGAYAISIAAGLVIVLSLHGSGAKIPAHILGPGGDIAAGTIGLMIALMLAAGHHTRLWTWYSRRKAAKASEKQGSRPGSGCWKRAPQESHSGSAS